VGLLYMSSFSKKVKNVGEEVKKAMSSKKYVQPFSEKKYSRICDIVINEAQMSDIYTGHLGELTGTTIEQRKCLHEFAEKRRAKSEKTKRRKISEITQDELENLEHFVDKEQFKRVKDARKKIEEYIKPKEDPVLKHDSGDYMFDPLKFKTPVKKFMTPVKKSVVSTKSDESDDSSASINMFGPKILVDEVRIEHPTIDDILDNSDVYIEWRKSIEKLKKILKQRAGGKSRKMNRKTRRKSNRKTRRY
jgi:hypothetical protein